MNIKLWAGIFLVLGTCIGAGLLALPITCAQVGLPTAILLVILVWFLMTAGAFLILEVVSWFPDNPHLVSMTKRTLGKPAAIIASLSSLALLYSLLAAYIATTTDTIHYLLQLIQIHFSIMLTAILVVLILGFIVFCGIYTIDLINRILMVLKIIFYAALILLIAKHVTPEHFGLTFQQPKIASIMIIATSFGFSFIIPSLRTYFNNDIALLRKMILIGSLIPLFFYLAWIVVVQGVLSTQTLLSLQHSANSTSQLVTFLISDTQSPSIKWVSRFFTMICVLTSFLGVAMALSDFIADGLKWKKTGIRHILVDSLTLLPPLLLVLFWPGIFMLALQYAGIFCFALLVLLPALMAWFGRYHHHYATKNHYQYTGGKTLLLLLIFASIALILWNITLG